MHRHKEKAPNLSINERSSVLVDKNNCPKRDKFSTFFFCVLIENEKWQESYMLTLTDLKKLRSKRN